MKPLIGSMCTGYGGLETAVHEVFGGTVAWHAEIDPDASKVLAHRFPRVPNLGDITKVRWPAVKPVDIVTAGFPCQDISYAGRGAGIQEGNRSGLWHTIADALGRIRPRLVVLENVGAIVARRPGLDVVLADLAALGFDAEWTCVRASDVGAPHRRERWFLVAQDANGSTRGEWGIAAPGQEASGRPWTDAGRRGGAPAADADRDTLRQQPVTESGRSRSAIAGLDGVHRDVPADAYGETGRFDVQGSGPGQIQGPAVAERPAQQPGRLHSSSGGPVPVAWGQFESGIRRWERITGRPAPDPTEPGRTGSRLSPRFVEWLMGLPAGFVTDVAGISRNAQLRILGNGVVPQQAAYGLRILTAHLTEAAA